MMNKPYINKIVFLLLLSVPLLMSVPAAMSATTGDLDSSDIKTIGKTIVAGATPGKFEVSNLGGASYRIPIATPPGVAGFSISLALSYSSDNHGGRLLGPGWNLTGLSSIHRCPATPAIHGRRGAILFDDNDELCLDGMVLMSESPEHQSIGECTHPRYTHMEMFARLVCNDGDADYRVESRDGTQYFYGGTQAHLGQDDKVLSWLLSRAQDRNGNNIRIEYDGDSNERYVSRIVYGGTDNIEIIFEYRELNESVTYIAGEKVTESRQLTALKTFVGDKIARAYHFEYMDDDRHDEIVTPRLKRLYECDGSGNCFAPTEFQWEPQTVSFVQHTAPLAYEGKDRDSGFYSADFNGDGVPDWYKVEVDKKNDSIFIAQVDADADTVADTLAYQTLVAPDITLGAKKSKSHYRFADFDGDGRTDIYIFRHRHIKDVLLLARVSEPDDDAEEGELYFDERDGINSGYRISPSEGGACVHVRCTRLADFDGDGRIDVYHIRHNAPDTIYLFRDDGFEQIDGVTARPQNQGKQAVESVRARDFNGDGRADIYYIDEHEDRLFLNRGDGVFEQQTGPTTYVNLNTDEKENVLHKVRFGDFNGDRLTDVLYMRKGRAGDIWLSHGDGEWSWLAAPRFGSDNTRDQLGDVIGRMKFVDMNADGRTDVYYINGDKSKSPDAIYLSGIDGVMHRYSGPKTRVGGEGIDLNHIRFGDFNGDGMTDVYQLKGDASGEAQLWINAWRPPMITRIQNGMGLWRHIHYSPLPAVHEAAAQAHYPNIRIPSQFIVASVDSADGIGGSKRMSYRYGGGLLHILGHGRLGFLWRTQTDELLNIGQSYFYQQEFPYIGSVSEQSTYSLHTNTDGNTDATVTLSTEHLRYAHRTMRNENTYFVYPLGKEQQTYDPTDDIGSAPLTNVVETYQGWDDYGNAARLTHTVSANGETRVKTERRLWENDDSEWLRSDLRRREVIASRRHQYNNDYADDITYVVSMDYDGRGRMNEMKILPDDNNGGEHNKFILTMRYQYDDYGNRIVEAAHGLTASVNDDNAYTWSKARHVKQYAYTDDGRFVGEQTNALGHILRNEYDGRTGKIIGSEDADGRRIQNRYDAWGRKVYGRDAAGVETYMEHTRAIPADAPPTAEWAINVTTPGKPFRRLLYDAYGRLVQTRVVGFDGRFVVTDRTYNAHGLLVSETRPYFFDSAVARMTYAYDPLGRVTLKHMPAPTGGSVTVSMTYGAHYVVESNSRNESLTVYYNAMGQPVEVRDAVNGTVHRQYDAAARLTAVITPNGNTVRTSYDAFSRIASVDDSISGARAYHYDAFGRLVLKTRAGEEHRMFYDAIGRMQKRIEPEGVAVWEFDTAPNGIGQIASETYRGHTRSYVYDDAGRLVRIDNETDDNPYHLSIHYDEYGRIGRVNRSAGFSLERVYNRHGYLVSVEGPPLVEFASGSGDRSMAMSVTEYTHYAGLYRAFADVMPDKRATLMQAADALDEVAMEIDAHFGATPAGDDEWFAGLDYFYAAERHLTYASDSLADARTCGDGECMDIIFGHHHITVARAYLDDAQIYAPAAEWSPQLSRNDNIVYWRVLARDAQGRVIESQTGNGVVSKQDYIVGTDYISRVAHTINETTFAETLYRYDAWGNLTTRESPLTGTRAQYAYDELGRLTMVSANDVNSGDVQEDYSREYRYGASGQPVWNSDKGAYHYDADKPYALSSLGADGYRYDIFGRLLGGGGMQVQWHSFDKPASVERNSAWSNFRYDAGRNRIEQCKSDGSCIYYFGKLYERAEQADGGVEHRHYIQADQNIVLLIRDLEKAGTMQRVLRYLHYDAHGSVDSVTDGVGRLVERIRYDSSGRRMTSDGLGKPVRPLFVRRGYTGHEHLDELGMIHMNGRLFATDTGRFISPDPFVPSWLSTQGHDRYGYAFNNPFKFSDPSGFFFKKIFKELKRFVRKVARAITHKPQIVLAIAAGYYAGSLVAKFSALSPTGTAILHGAVGGATASLVVGGDLRDIVVGAIAGGALGALGAHYGTSWPVERFAAESAVNGVAAELRGGKFGHAAFSTLGANGLKYTAWTMRQRMIAQSMLNADNASGISEGFNGDGFKLGGGRVSFEGGGPSPLGGHQGGQGSLFGMPYQPGSFYDKLVEAYAGPHDYLNSAYWYGADGNIRMGMSAFEKGIGELLNAANVVIATPLVAASVAPSYIFTLGDIK